MKFLAYAKLNLTLDITGVRADGYHELSSVMQQISLYDDVDITVLESDENFVTFDVASCRFLPSDSRNTCVKAAQIFLENYGIEHTGVFIKLRKRIPVCSGMGGGSSDAAAVLKGLNTMLKVNASASELEQLGLKVGADVPFFIRGGAQLVRGIGEKLTPLDLDFKQYFLVVKPACGASTQEIYGMYDESPGEFSSRNTDAFLSAVRAGRDDALKFAGNRLLSVTERLLPQMASVYGELKKFSECVSMTGSGSALFAAFESWFKANKALHTFNRREGVFAKLCLAVDGQDRDGSAGGPGWKNS